MIGAQDQRGAHEIHGARHAPGRGERRVDAPAGACAGLGAGTGAGPGAHRFTASRDARELPEDAPTRLHDGARPQIERERIGGRRQSQRSLRRRDE